MLQFKNVDALEQALEIGLRAGRSATQFLIHIYNLLLEPGRFLCHGPLRGPGGTAYSGGTTALSSQGGFCATGCCADRGEPPTR